MPSAAVRFMFLLLCCGLAILVSALAWWLPNRPQPVGSDPAAAPPGLIQSVSFAPFRRGQGPFTKIFPTPDEVAEDLASVAKVAKGVRTYTAREGLQVVPELARRYQLDVIHSAWLGPKKNINEQEIEALIDQANRYPDTIKRIIVGNEVLLRKDLTADELIGYIRRVRAAVKQPVSYADVWEFWLKNPRLLEEVDFVTVHFLPYWEDNPIGVAHAMPHIMDIYRIVQARLPGKPVLIGEVGWPSQGRSRRAAVPSRIEAAAFITDFMRLAQKEGFDYNLVEAFDQPWKAKLEGTVGGAWGVLDEVRHPKFRLGAMVSELPDWPIYAAFSGLIGLILLVLQLPRVMALSFPKVAVAVGAAQAAGIALAACIEHGLSHYFSAARLTEFILLFGLQSAMAVLLFAELLDRLAGRQPPRLAFSGMLDRLRELRSFGPLYLPLGNHTVSAEKMERFRAEYRVRLGEWLLIFFTLYAVYETLMLALVGRYRDFPIDYALLPIAGFLVLRLVSLATSGAGAAGPWSALALASGFAVRQPNAGRPDLRMETILIWLLVLGPSVMLLVERISNREAIYWGVIVLAYILPLIGNLRLGAAKSS